MRSDCQALTPSLPETTLIFFMQAGFAMMEAGIVHPKNVTNILFKNIIDASLEALFFWTVGYGVSIFSFSPLSNSLLVPRFPSFQFTVSAVLIYARMAGNCGSCSGPSWQSLCQSSQAPSLNVLLCTLTSSCVFSIFIYPVVTHWVWGRGFLSEWGAMPDADSNARPLFLRTTESNGLIDFAGCGPVHMVGGVTGLVGAIIIGPHSGCFDNYGSPLPRGQVNEIYSTNKTLQTLGTSILWFEWYGFNVGSTIGLSNNLV